MPFTLVDIYIDDVKVILAQTDSPLIHVEEGAPNCTQQTPFSSPAQTHKSKGKKASLLKNVLDETLKVTNFIKPQHFRMGLSNTLTN